MIKTEKLILPFGNVQILLNGSPIPFQYEEEKEYNKIWLEDDTEITPLKMINILIETTPYKQNDELYIYCDAGYLKDDGGGEYVINAVEELNNYTYGIGGPDTEYIEWNYGNIPGSTPNAEKYGYTNRDLSYEFIGITNYGLKYKIINTLNNDNRKIYINTVYESNEKEYAYDVVSCLTS